MDRVKELGTMKNTYCLHLQGYRATQAINKQQKRNQANYCSVNLISFLTHGLSGLQFQRTVKVIIRNEMLK
jgi:hypothetical protein